MQHHIGIGGGAVPCWGVHGEREGEAEASPEVSGDGDVSDLAQPATETRGCRGHPAQGRRGHRVWGQGTQVRELLEYAR